MREDTLKTNVDLVLTFILFIWYIAYSASTSLKIG
jgi:hypothetical protein